MTAIRTARVPMIAAFAVAGLLCTGAATASPASSASVEVAQVVVRYGDLNLDSDRGLAALYRRLEAAAVAVCGRPDQRDLRLAGLARDCQRAAMAGAVAKVGVPRLAERHASAQGRVLGG